MKKLKLLLSSLLACVLAFSLAGCSANCGGDDGPTDEPGDDEVVGTLFNIEVDTSAAKTEYFCGDEFTSEGLVVTSYIRTGTGTGSITQTTLEADQYTVDSSAFNTDEAGTYTITVSYTYGDVTRDADYNVTVVEPVRVSRLVIDTTGARTIFNNGDEFSAEGLVVTAIDTDYRTNTDLTPYDVTDDIAIDSAAYDADTDGDYTIGVSYTKEGTTVETSYTVKVMTAAGLKVVLPTDETTNAVIDTYDYATAGTEIDITDIEVYEADANGVADDAQPLDKANLTFKAYRGHADNEYTITNNIFTADQTGAYTIEAVYEDYVLSNSETTDLIGFAIVYVVDELKSLGFAGGTTTQTAGADVMSDTWTFTATYASGATKTLTAEEVEIEGVVTNAATEAGEATVTYTELNAKGEEDVVSTTVNYVVEERQAAVSGVAGIGFDNMIVGAYNVEYDATIHGALSISDSNNIVTSATVNGARPGKTDNWNINSLEEPATITTDNGDVTVNKAFQLRGGSYTTRRNVQIELPTDATYTINVWASNSNAGRYVVAYNGTDSSWHFDYDENGTAVTSPNAPAYAVGESVTSSISKRTLNNAAGGTYYIGGNGDITIYYIEIIAEANEPQGQIYSIDFTDTTKIATNENFVGADATELVAITDVSGNATGFYVTKCGSSGKYTAITTKNSIQCLQFQGAGTTEKNSIAITVGPGEVEVVMSYYQNKDGRYLKVLNEGLDTVPATSDELTSTDYSIKTRTVKFTLTEATTIYIGSAESGLYVSSISIIVK